jgi:hypothetical protein
MAVFYFVPFIEVRLYSTVYVFIYLHRNFNVIYLHRLEIGGSAQMCMAMAADLKLTKICVQ